jgi:hypothetical protein
VSAKNPLHFAQDSQLLDIGQLAQALSPLGTLLAKHLPELI